MKKVFFAFTLAAILMLPVSMSMAAPELTLIIASNATDLTNPYSYGLDKFKEVAEEISGGKAVTERKPQKKQKETGIYK